MIATPARATADEAELRPYRPHFWVMAGILAVAGGLVAGIALRLFLSLGPYGDYEYRLWRWQAETLVSTAFHAIGADGPGPELGDNETLQLYYGYTSQLRSELIDPSPDIALVDTLTGERAVYAHDVEHILTERIEAAIDTAGLQESPPFFTDVAFTWPPVSFRITTPPQLLVTSPRDRIERSGDTLLRTGLTSGEIANLEDRADSDDQVSLVVSIGGLAAYPAFVRDDRNYYSTVETAAHEWVHHYLAFYPLGQTWGTNQAATTLNETTANIAGKALAELVHQQSPVSLEAGADGSAPARAPVTIDFNETMRTLRKEVDALLVAGKTTEAEALMEETRLRLADNGIVIRKLNQAYFAFYGSYGDSPASSDPIGPKVERVWELSGDVGTFLETMREVTSVADLDETVTKLEAITGAQR